MLAQRQHRDVDHRIAQQPVAEAEGKHQQQAAARHRQGFFQAAPETQHRPRQTQTPAPAQPQPGKKVPGPDQHPALETGQKPDPGQGGQHQRERHRHLPPGGQIQIAGQPVQGHGGQQGREHQQVGELIHRQDRRGLRRCHTVPAQQRGQGERRAAAAGRGVQGELGGHHRGHGGAVAQARRPAIEHQPQPPGVEVPAHRDHRHQQRQPAHRHGYQPCQHLLAAQHKRHRRADQQCHREQPAPMPRHSDSDPLAGRRSFSISHWALLTQRRCSLSASMVRRQKARLSG